jgi:hypothetical protein
VGFQFMLILGLLGMYFDATLVFYTKSSLLFKLAVAILCLCWWSSTISFPIDISNIVQWLCIGFNFQRIGFFNQQYIHYYWKQYDERLHKNFYVFFF